MKSIFRIFAVALVLAISASQASAVVIPVQEDVMASSFFQGSNTIRGYAGDVRPVFRVSTNNPFGTSGAETIYLTFDSAQFTGLTAPVVSAVLTLQSVAGGFAADADPSTPFTVSAHGVSSNPLTTIIDDTNPGGSKSWFAFYNDDILAADPAASTAVDGFGTFTFNVTAVVNDWLSGANTVFALALTGKNDTSGNEFLHGFLNDTEAPGSTFLTVTTVPEPATLVVGLVGMVGCVIGRRRSA